MSIVGRNKFSTETYVPRVVFSERHIRVRHFLRDGERVTKEVYLYVEQTTL